MTTQRDPEIAAAEALLRAAADAPEPPSQALMARVLADADAMQPMPVQSPRPVPGVVSQLRAALGGWRGLGGLVAATCAGFWIGVSPPAAVPDAGAFLLGVEPGEAYETSGAYGGFGWDMEEG